MKEVADSFGSTTTTTTTTSTSDLSLVGYSKVLPLGATRSFHRAKSESKVQIDFHEQHVLHLCNHIVATSLKQMKSRSTNCELSEAI